MDQVHDLLWVSDIDSVQTHSLPEGVDRVVTVCQDNVIDNVSCAYEWYNMSDGPANSYGGDSSFSLFSQAAGSVLDAMERGEGVLVHCHMGQSRSVAVAAAALAALGCGHFYTEMFNVMDARGTTATPDEILKRHGVRFVRDVCHA